MNHIPLTPVESSTIKAVGYDPASKTLAVQFIARGKTPPPPSVYHYPGIEQKFYDELQKAESKGKFIIANVTKPKLPFTKHELPTA